MYGRITEGQLDNEKCDFRKLESRPDISGKCREKKEHIFTIFMSLEKAYHGLE